MCVPELDPLAISPDSLELTLTPLPPWSPPTQFVYPFTLEPHILSNGPPHRALTASRQAGHVAYLLGREAAKEDRRKKELARVAPGWTGGGGALVPDRPATQQAAPSQQVAQGGTLAGTSSGGGPSEGGQPRSLLETELAGLDLSEPKA